MVVENDINKINQKLREKVLKEVIKNVDGVTMVFEDGTKFQIKAYQYQMLL